MSRRIILPLALAALTACGKGEQKTALADSTVRDLQLAPVDSSATLNDQPAPQPDSQPKPVEPKPAPPPASKPKPPTPTVTAPKPAQPQAPAALTLAAGAHIPATANDTITSRHNKAGESFTATVSQDIVDDHGKVVIPSGSTLTFVILELAPAENRGQKDGKLSIQATEVAIHGTSYPISAHVDSVTHVVKGRGVTAGDAGKVGGGAVIGAIAGRIIGGNTKGAVIGGAVGAAAGTGVAVETADRDVVVPTGAAIIITLNTPLTVK